MLGIVSWKMTEMLTLRMFKKQRLTDTKARQNDPVEMRMYPVGHTDSATWHFHLRHDLD